MVFNRLNRASLSSILIVSAFTICLLSSETSAFRHPGVLVNKDQLDFIKTQVTAGAAPWMAAFDKARTSSFGSLSYTPHPHDSVGCGPTSNPDIGCSDEKNDAAASYTQALLWYFSGNQAYATNAITILNAWSAVMKGHYLSNAPLQSGWCGSLFPRAAEIMRYANSGWAATDIDRFSTMLRTAYIPYIINGSCSNGNWELSMIEALTHISVFLDDTTMFNKAVSMWRARVPAYFYLSTDGALPVPPPNCGTQTQAALTSFWYGQTTFVDGLCQETCRDFNHTQYGLAATINAAETARIQGVDLYGEQSKRIVAAMEFHAGIITGQPAPSSVCGGSPNVSTSPMWEIGYNHYHNRMGIALPFTNTVITRIRPTGTDHHMDWETLTHAEIGDVGILPVAAIRAPSARGSTALIQPRVKAGLFFRKNGSPCIVVRALSSSGKPVACDINGVVAPAMPVR
jgi:Alginate lyase